MLAACLAAMFMAAIEMTIVSAAMPSIVGQLGGFALFGWVFDAYLLPQAVSVPIYGRLADLYGRKPVFLGGATLFLVGSVLCGFAPSMLALVLCRALQGLGGGAIIPMAQTIVADVYEARERPRIQGYISTVWGVSAIIGPAAGAFIVQHLPWAFIFWINVPLGFIAMALVAFFLVDHKRAPGHRLDLVGVTLLTVATATLILALLQADRLGWWTPLPVAVALVAGTLFFRHERHSASPLLPIVLWRQRAVAASTAGSFLVGTLMMEVSAFVPTYIQGVMGKAPSVAGLALTAMSVAWPVGSLLGARVMLRTTYRTTATCGVAGIAVGAAALLLIRPADGLWAAGIGATIMGVGMGFCALTFLISSQEAASVELRGAVTSSITFTRILGQTIGTAVLGGILNVGLAWRLPSFTDPVRALTDPAQRGALAAADIATLSGGVGASLHDVYVASALIALAVIFVARQIPAGLRPGAAE